MSQRVADVCLGALAQVVPGRVGAASQGTMNNVLLGGDGWVYYETIGGGQGGRPWADGMSGVHTAMTNTREHADRGARARVAAAGAALRGCAGGAAAPVRHTGGDGIERELEMLEDVTVSLITERRRSRAVGARRRRAGRDGRELAAAGRRRGGGPSGCPTSARVQLHAGDVLRMCTPGGGGYGRARLEREPGQSTGRTLTISTWKVRRGPS